MSIYAKNLLCEYKKEPVIDSKKIRFSWQVAAENEDRGRSVYQKAYQITISEISSETNIFDSLST